MGNSNTIWNAVLTLTAGDRVRRRAGLRRSGDLLLGKSLSLGGERRLRGGERGMRDLGGDNGLQGARDVGSVKDCFWQEKCAHTNQAS